MSARIGSLFSGYGGLEMGVQAMVGGAVAWHCEFDLAPSKILAHHWPTVPNLGDITRVDWSRVEPVDVLTGGSPCQDVSAAGRRAGMKAGTRSGLWASMVDAIDALRPRLVVWENVRGVTSAEADSGLEHCPGCMGDPADRGVVLRALGRVLGDLADLGYDARWYGLRAADIGAPHGRYRIFVAATDTGSEHRGERRQPAPGQTQGGRAFGEPAGRGRASAADADGSGLQGRRAGAHGSEVTEPVSAGTTPADASGSRLRQHPGAAPTEEARARGCDEFADHRRARTDTDWGPYRPAIERWERVLGRPAPAPTELAPKGGQRLSPALVEWMMGLPAGHVTDPAIGISRNEQLKALGNGVVPQQAAAAVSLMLNRAAVAA